MDTDHLQSLDQEDPTAATEEDWLDVDEQDLFQSRSSFYSDDDPHAIPPVGLFPFAFHRHAEYWELVYRINAILDPLTDGGKLCEELREKTKDYYWGAATYLERNFLVHPRPDPNHNELAGEVIAALANGKSLEHIKRWTGWDDEELRKTLRKVFTQD